MPNEKSQYTSTAKVLHWLVAALIVLQYLLAELAERAADSQLPVLQLALLANHKSVGITVLILAIVRIVWRFTHRAPPQPTTLPLWQRSASATVHWMLYLLLFAVPLSGWLMSSASAYSVSWFNLWQLPDLVAADENLKTQMQTAHYWLGQALLVISGLHLGAALLHQFWSRDEVMGRMLDAKNAFLFALVLGLGATAIAAMDSGKSANATGNNASETTPAVADAFQANATRSTASESCATQTDAGALWAIDYAASAIRFAGEQAGASFSGQFDDWQAHIRFDPARLDASCALVTIRLASVNSQDADRDATVAEADWFNTAHHPVALYTAHRFTEQDGAYIANGHLELKGVKHSVPLTFTLDTSNQSYTLQGSADLDRLALNLGTGDWVDTSWVGQYFSIDVTVAAPFSPNPT